MAIIDYEPSETPIRGRIQGTVFASSRYGFYTRNSPKPVDSPTNRRVLRTVSLGRASGRWRDDLASGQVSAWNSLGATTTFFDANGSPYSPSGRNLYIRTNALRFSSGLSPIDTAPALAFATDFGRHYFWDNASQQLAVSASSSTPNSYRQYYYLSHSLPPSRFSYTGPYFESLEALASVIKNDFDLGAPGRYSTGRHAGIHSVDMASDGSLTEPTFTVFPCLEDQMFTLTASDSSFVFSSTNKANWLQLGLAQFLANSATVGAQLIFPFPCRLRHVAVHHRTNAKVGTPPFVKAVVRKFQLDYYVLTIAGSLTAHTDQYVYESNIVGKTFAAGDQIAIWFSCNCSPGDVLNSDTSMIWLFFEPGDFT